VTGQFAAGTGLHNAAIAAPTHKDNRRRG